MAIKQYQLQFADATKRRCLINYDCNSRDASDSLMRPVLHN